MLALCTRVGKFLSVFVVYWFLHMMFFQRACHIFWRFYNRNHSLLFLHKIKSHQRSALTPVTRHWQTWSSVDVSCVQEMSSQRQPFQSWVHDISSTLNEAAVITLVQDGRLSLALGLDKCSATLWCCQRFSPLCSEQRLSSSKIRGGGRFLLLCWGCQETVWIGESFVWVPKQIIGGKKPYYYCDLFCGT